jgi:TonB family protein
LSSPTALVAPAAAPAAAPKTSTQAVRVSTGVTAPVVVKSAPLATHPLTLDLAAQHQAEMVVDLTVNEKGEPTNVRVQKSFDPAVDAAVVDAVRQYKFRPGTLDQQPIAVDVALKVQFER